jgi:hypothetical protein
LTLRESIQRRELKRLAKSVARLAEELEQAEDFPTDTARELCKVIRETANLIGENIDTAPSDQLSHIHFLLGDLGEDLRYPERSRIEQTPWSIVQATESLLQAHVGPECRFIIRPQWPYNYGLDGEFIASYHKRIETLSGWISISQWKKRISNSYNHRIYCISFPRVEKMNVLAHVNWGHEVGHILATNWLTNHFPRLWKARFRGVQKRVRKDILSQFVDGYKPPIGWVTARVADVLNETMHLTQKAFKELISDSVGAHLFGPATLASLGEFSCHNKFDAGPLQSRGYPPWRYRLRLIVQAVMPSIKKAKTREWHPTLRRYAAWLKHWEHLTTDKTDIKRINEDVRTREAYELVQEKWPNVWKQVLATLPKNVKAPYRLPDRHKHVGELIDRLKRDIPPNETGTWPDTQPASLADIWNAAWAFKIAKFTKSSAYDDDYLATLFQLTLKAIEASYVHSTFGRRLGTPGIT